MQFVIGRAGHCQPPQIALHIGYENRNAKRGEAVNHPLQCYRFARAGCARDQAVAVGAFQVEILRLAISASADKNALFIVHA